MRGELQTAKNHMAVPCHTDAGLWQQTANNTKEQFATSPDLDAELMNAIVDALDAHNSMSTKALNSETVRKGLKNILLN